MQITSRMLSAVYGLSGLLVALAFAWALLVANNYFYGLWHDYAGIGDAIEKYGPLNRYREGFADTSREQRVVLFGKIATAVHNDGQGLEKIFYLTPANAPGVPLLHEAEIVHLNDVAALINIVQNILIFASVFWLVATGFFIYKNKPLPGVKAQIIGFGTTICISVAIVLLFGWEKVFNQFHIWIFPEEHQWFFYYQDSLMSTMMWAPHLFKYIGLCWAGFTVVLFVFLLWLQHWLNKRFLKRPEN